MFSFTWLWLLVAATLSAAQSVQNDWVSPQFPDDTTKVNINQNVQIQWTSNLQSWFSSSAPSVDIGKADLWVTSADQRQFRHLVAAGVNVKNSSRVIQWNAQIPAEELSQTTAWVLRFVQSGVVPLSTSNSISSPRFVIRSSSSSTASAGTASAMPTSLYPASPYSDGSADPGTNETLPGLTPPTTRDDEWVGISGGVIAAIVVGVIFAGLALIFLGWFIVRRMTPPRPSAGSPKDLESTFSKEKQGFASSFASRFRRTKDHARLDESRTSSPEPETSGGEPSSRDHGNSVTRNGIKMTVHYKKDLSKDAVPNRQLS